LVDLSQHRALSRYENSRLCICAGSTGAEHFSSSVASTSDLRLEPTEKMYFGSPPSNLGLAPAGLAQKGPASARWASVWLLESGASECRERNASKGLS